METPRTLHLSCPPTFTCPVPPLPSLLSLKRVTPHCLFILFGMLLLASYFELSVPHGCSDLIFIKILVSVWFFSPLFFIIFGLMKNGVYWSCQILCVELKFSQYLQLFLSGFLAKKGHVCTEPFISYQVETK